MIASNNLFVKGLTRFLPNGRVFGVGGRNDNAKHLSRHAVIFCNIIEKLHLQRNGAPLHSLLLNSQPRA